MRRRSDRRGPAVGERACDTPTRQRTVLGHRSCRDGVMVDRLMEKVRGLPPSAKLVFKVLEMEGELTQRQLTERTLLPPRTVRYALSELEQRGVVEKRFSFADARQRCYSLTSSVPHAPPREEHDPP